MTQLTKREQIAFALFLEQYKSDTNSYSVDEMIRKSVFIADAFLKHLSETEVKEKISSEDLSFCIKAEKAIAKDVKSEPISGTDNKFVVTEKESIAEVVRRMIDAIGYKFKSVNEGDPDLQIFDVRHIQSSFSSHTKIAFGYTDEHGEKITNTSNLVYYSPLENFFDCFKASNLLLLPFIHFESSETK